MGGPFLLYVRSLLTPAVQKARCLLRVASSVRVPFEAEVLLVRCLPSPPKIGLETVSSMCTSAFGGAYQNPAGASRDPGVAASFMAVLFVTARTHSMSHDFVENLL